MRSYRDYRAEYRRRLARNAPHVAPHRRVGRAAPAAWEVCRDCRSVLPWHALDCAAWVPTGRAQRVSGA